MQTQLPEAILATSSGRRADEILRACVHCGFCNATCPTYLLDRRRTRRPARPHLPDQGHARSAGAHVDRARASRSLPHVSRVRDHVPVGRGVWRARGDRSQLHRSACAAAIPRTRGARMAGAGVAGAGTARVVRPTGSSRALGDAGLPRSRGAAHPLAPRGAGEEPSASRGRARRMRATLYHAGSERGARARARCRGREGDTRRG